MSTITAPLRGRFSPARILAVAVTPMGGWQRNAELVRLITIVFTIWAPVFFLAPAVLAVAGSASSAADRAAFVQSRTIRRHR